MFHILHSLWNYGWLAHYIIQFYQLSRRKDINENDINLFIHNLIPSIEKCGCVCTKFAQWITPILDNLYNKIDEEPYWFKKLERFYENCQDHSLEYTIDIYNKDFKTDFYDRYTIEDMIGSGSIGQVYKIKDNHTKIDYAMKVLHPNVYYDMWLMKKIINLLLWIPYTQKIIYDILPIDIYEFVDIFEKQIDMIHEANNLCRMKYLHKNNYMIIIPDLISCSPNIIIMSYEDGETLDSSKQSDYIKYKHICLLYLFVRNTVEINNFMHGDIHKGNWKIRDDKIVLYDFGFCWSILNKDKYINTNLYPMMETVTCDDLSHLVEFTEYTLYNHTDKVKQDIQNYFDKPNNNFADASITFKMLCHVAKLNKLHINPNNILGIIMNMQTLKYWTKYSINNKNEKIKTDTSIYRRDYLNYISICQTYDIFPELQLNLKKLLNDKKVTVTEIFDTVDQNNTINDEIKGLLKFD